MRHTNSVAETNPTATPYQTEIVYHVDTHDFAMYVNGELVGFAHTYVAAEATLDALIDELSAADPEETDGPSEDGGEGGPGLPGPFEDDRYPHPYRAKGRIVVYSAGPDRLRLVKRCDTVTRARRMAVALNALRQMPAERRAAC